MLFKNVFFFALLVLLGTTAFSQSKKDAKKNKIKSIRESHTILEEGKESTYDALFRKFDGNGNVATYDSCPVLGIRNGYSGICDPTNNAGCNIPIYKVGAQTTFTGTNGQSFTYNDYPIVWSGYAKKWAIILTHYHLEKN